MIWEIWKKRFLKIQGAGQRLGIDCREVIIKPIADENQLQKLELELGTDLPESFKKVLSEFSSHVEVRWFLQKNKRKTITQKIKGFFHQSTNQDTWLEPPGDLSTIFSGDCRWDLNRIIELEKERQEWIENCFPNIDDPYDRVWHNKLAFQDVGNGDMLAIDLESDTGAVVYISHDDGNLHGQVLAENFIEFIDRWSLIGFVGADEWQLEPFIPPSKDGIDPQCENAVSFRKWFGISFE